MSKHELKFRFTDQDGNQGKIRIYLPDDDVDDYSQFTLGGEGSEHVLIAINDKPDLDDFEDSERPKVIKGKDEDGNKVYIAYAGIKDPFSVSLEDEEGMAIEVAGGSGSGDKASRLADKLNRHLGKDKKTVGKSSGAHAPKASRNGQKATKGMLSNFSDYMDELSAKVDEYSDSIDAYAAEFKDLSDEELVAIRDDKDSSLARRAGAAAVIEARKKDD